MAVTATPVFVQNPKITPITIVNADASNQKTVATAGSNGMKITALFATSDDSSDRVVKVSLTRSATAYLMAAVNVPDLSGTDGTNATVNLMNSTQWPGLPVDNDGQPYLLMESGDTLSVSTTTTVTSGRTVTVTSIGGNF